MAWSREKVVRFIPWNNPVSPAQDNKKTAGWTGGLGLVFGDCRQAEEAITTHSATWLLERFNK